MNEAMDMLVGDFELGSDTIPVLVKVIVVKLVLGSRAGSSVFNLVNIFFRRQYE